MHVLTAILLAMTVSLARPSSVRAGCNIIPPVQVQALPSTLGSVASPITAAGQQVEIDLASECDVLGNDLPAYFEPSAPSGQPPSNVVTIRFLPAGPGQPPPVQVTPDEVVGCAGAGGTAPCTTLRFTMPDTSAPGTPNGLAGPAEITVTNDLGEVAHIGPLFEPHVIGSSCDKQPEQVFRQFTVLPPPNDFKDLATHLAAGTATQALATLDGGGNLLVPIDWVDALPAGPGFPVAALVSGILNVDAFPGTPGPIHVAADDVRSFTIDAKPLPPLIRVTDAGNSVFGTSDAALSVIRVARLNAQGQPNFDLSHFPDFATHAPIVFRYDPPTRMDFSVAKKTSVPLVELKTSPTGAVFATDEAVEHLDLNGPVGVGDGDQTDQVVQFTETASGVTTNPRMAASKLSNPIVGPAAIAIGGNLAAFIQGEVNENAGGAIGGTDLNGGGQTTDDILRVFTLQGAQRTDASRLANLFPAINRNPVAVDGSLVYYRSPGAGAQYGDPGVDLREYPVGSDLTGAGEHALITQNGRILVTTRSGGCEVDAQALDGATGLPVGPIAQHRNCPTSVLNRYAGGLAIHPQVPIVFAAATGSPFRIDALNLVAPQPGSDAAVLLGGPVGQNSVVEGQNDQAGHLVSGLQGVARLAITPPVDPDARGYHVYLYALSPAERAVAAFDVSVKLGVSLFAAQPQLLFVQSLVDTGVWCPTCLTDFTDTRNLALSPDGASLYVAVHGTDRVRGFKRHTGGAIEGIDEWIDGSNGGPSLAGPVDVAVSPDGKQVYVLADGDASLSTFSRDQTTGLLTFVSAIVNSGIHPIQQPTDLVVSPDGKAVYVVGNGSRATFARNTATGTLTWVDGVAGDSRLGSPSDATMSPDSERLYLQYLDGSGSNDYRAPRVSRLRAFDATTQANRSGLDAWAETVAVANGSAAWTNAYAIFPFGADLHLFDGSQTRLIDGSVDPNKLALSSQALMYATPTVGNLVVMSTATLAKQSLPQSDPIGDIGVTDVCTGGANNGDACSTSANCPGGECEAVAVFTTVSASGRSVLHLYHASSQVTDTIGTFQDTNGVKVLPSVVDFQVSGNIIAFRVDELGQTDLNDDGDTTDVVMEDTFTGHNFLTSDAVMFAYHLKSRRLFSTRMAAARCEVDGCEPGLPYKVPRRRSLLHDEGAGSELQHFGDRLLAALRPGPGSHAQAPP